MMTLSVLALEMDCTADVRELSLTLPSSVVESGGTLPITGQVAVTSIATNDIVVALNASLPTELTIPSSVIIGAGHSNAAFVLFANQNEVPDGTRSVTVHASAAGFSNVSKSITVFDDDAHHFRFFPIASPQDSSIEFGVTIWAEDANDEIVANFNRTLPLTVTGLDGNLAVEPSAPGPFSSGIWSGGLRVTSPGRLIQLSSPLAPGQSNPFHVQPQVITVLHQRVGDIAWHAPSRTLVASVPSDAGSNANRLILIDPLTGAITNSHPLVADPGQIEMAFNSQFLYVTASNRLALCRFDMATRQPGTPFAVGSYSGQPNYVTDFAVLTGPLDSVIAVTSTTPGGNYGGVLRFDSGAPIILEMFNAVQPYWIESSTGSSTLYGFQNNNSYPLMRGLAQPGSPLVVSNGVFGGNRITYRHGVLYDNTGRAVVADTFVTLGDYAGMLERLGDSAVVEVDPYLKRTIYLSGSANLGFGFYKLKAYDRDSFVPLGQLTLPVFPGGAGRLVLCGTNGLAFHTSDQVWFVRSSLLQPSQPPANLVLTQTAAPLPAILGSNVTFTLTVSNSGPGLATFVNVSDTLPANASMLFVAASTGSVSQTADVLNWSLIRLDAGDSATLQFQLRPGSAGWMTNVASVNGYEPDPNFTNNISRLALFVESRPNVEGIVELRFSTEDIIYDSVLDRLLVSVASGSGGQAKGLAVLNPYNGTVQQFVSLNQKPSKLAGSLDGQFLYVSFPQDALIRRYALPAFSQDLEIALGIEFVGDIPSPNFAGNMKVLPDNPRSIAVSQVRAGSLTVLEVGRRIAIFDDGVTRSNFIPVSFGSFILEFDTDQKTLYAYQGGYDPFHDSVRRLSRCSIDAGGVAIAESFPQLDFHAGNDMKYAAGRFFNSAGRAVRTQPFGVTGTYSGSESALLVAPDAAAGRVFYLGNSDAGWQLRAYDIGSYNQLGSLVISNVVGTPSSLVRWGANGLAFRTSGGQVFLIHSSLVNSNSGVDLALSLDGPSTSISPGDTALFVVGLTNRGPATARELRITNSISPGAEIVWTAVTSGQASTNGGRIIWTLPEFSIGEEVFLAFVVRPAQSGTYTVSSDAFTETADDKPANNSAKAVLLVGNPLGSESVSVVSLPVNDLVWSPANARLLATVNGGAANWAGTLALVDPLTLNVTTSEPLAPTAGQLAISDDGTQLYAVLDFDVCNLSLPSLSLRHRFPLDVLGDPLRVTHFSVSPRQPDTIAVGRWAPYAFAADVAVYDNGILRSRTAVQATTSASLEFGDQSSPLYAYGGDFRRYTINADGVSLLDINSSLLPAYTPMELKWADGILFSSLGIAINPATRTPVGIVPGVTNHSPVCYDRAAQRAFFLSVSGTNAWIRAVDVTTLSLLGTKAINGIVGAPSSLVRWGTDGLAFRTSGDQVFVLRTGLVPSAPAADLSLSLKALSPVASVGNSFVYFVAVTNRGPNSAINGQILVRLSSNAGSLSVSNSQGTVAFTNQQVMANLGNLPMGGVATLSLTFTTREPGEVSILAKAVANSIDPVMSNNARSATNPAVQLLAPDSVTMLTRPSVDLSYNPASGRLYSSGGSQITVINPVLAQVETNWPLPGASGRLALSEDSKYLYAVLDSGYRLGRINISNGQPEYVFTPDDGSFGALFDISDIAILPGKPESYVLSGGAATHVYDGMVRRPRYMVDSAGVAFLEFGAISNIVYGSIGSRIRTLTIDDAGISETAWADYPSVVLGDFKFDHGLLFTPDGTAIETSHGAIAGRIAGLGSGTLLAPDPAGRRLFYLTKTGTEWQLRAYHAISLGFIGSISLSNVLGQPTRLVRCGQDGLAFATTSNQLFLLRTSLVSILADTDHDGLPDDWELANALDPSDPDDALTDLDGDGHNNLQEFLAGTDPRDARSILRFSSISVQGDFVRLVFAASSGKSYVVEGTTTLSGNDWTVTSGELVSNGAMVSVTISNTPSTFGRFFRVRALPMR